jgi:hypothetical protein
MALLSRFKLSWGKAGNYRQEGGPQQTSMAVIRSITLRLTLRSVVRTMDITAKSLGSHN